MTATVASIKITIEATIDTPDNRPVVDYIRAVGNYLVDKLPVCEYGTTGRQWSAGVGVAIATTIQIDDEEL